MQELSKITMPIVFNEPLSFLQRITEYMEHIYLINKACSHTDPLERMQVRIPTTFWVIHKVFFSQSLILRHTQVRSYLFLRGCS